LNLYGFKVLLQNNLKGRCCHPTKENEMTEKTFMILAMLMLCACGAVGIWNNWIGHNPNLPYSSRAPIHKFFGYLLWNMIAFFLFGHLKMKSWRMEHNEQLEREGLGCYKV
jgi:hypothetical protein